MRTLTDHKTTALNEALEITVLDEPGHGGACHVYGIRQKDTPLEKQGDAHTVIAFQNGPIQEFGVNGISQEALLAIVIDRLHCFQEGPFANEYNERALESCRDALRSLHARTKERTERGVEGTNQK